jgi:hypothetical protein
VTHLRACVWRAARLSHYENWAEVVAVGEVVADGPAAIVVDAMAERSDLSDSDPGRAMLERRARTGACRNQRRRTVCRCHSARCPP